MPTQTIILFTLAPIYVPLAAITPPDQIAQLAAAIGAVNAGIAQVLHWLPYLRVAVSLTLQTRCVRLINHGTHSLLPRPTGPELELASTRMSPCTPDSAQHPPLLSSCPASLQVVAELSSAPGSDVRVLLFDAEAYVLNIVQNFGQYGFNSPNPCILYTALGEEIVGARGPRAPCTALLCAAQHLL